MSLKGEEYAKRALDFGRDLQQLTNCGTASHFNTTRSWRRRRCRGCRMHHGPNSKGAGKTVISSISALSGVT